MRRKDLTTKQIFDPKNLKKGLFILLVAINMIPASLSMYYATNPAYSSALMSVEVVWVMLINKVLAYFGQPIEYKTKNNDASFFIYNCFYSIRLQI